MILFAGTGIALLLGYSVSPMAKDDLWYLLSLYLVFSIFMFLGFDLATS